MSCDNNRARYFDHLVTGAGAGASVTAADLEALYQARRGPPADRLAALMAEAKTRQLFSAMQRAGFTPPAHAANGLPKVASQTGYAAVYDHLQRRGWLSGAPPATELALAQMHAETGDEPARPVPQIAYERNG